LRTNFLTLGEVSRKPSVKFDKDTVISQSPSDRKIVARNTMVHLAVSDGPPADGTILMPDFAQKNWNDVLAWQKKTSP